MELFGTTSATTCGTGFTGSMEAHQGLRRHGGADVAKSELAGRMGSLSVRVLQGRATRVKNGRRMAS